MPVDSFRFISPGVFINEIDQSQISGIERVGAGPVVFGVTERGPALVPTRVTSFAEFVSIFGNPLPGNGKSSDVWRVGNYANPTYGAYAAQAYLANGSPLTFVRLVGDEDPSKLTGGEAGWEIGPSTGAAASTSTTGVWGLFIIGSGSHGTPVPINRQASDPGNPTGHGEGMCAAIFYTSGSSTKMMLSGAIGENALSLATASAGALMRPIQIDNTYEYCVVIDSTLGLEQKTFNFDPTSPRFIRNVFNCNPHLLNSNITADASRKSYWLGESYGRGVTDFVSNLHDAATGITRTNMSGTYGVLLSLASSSVALADPANPAAAPDVGGGDHQRAYATPATPWIIGQDLGTGSNFDINATTDCMFRIHSRHGTEYAQANYKISFAEIKPSPTPQYIKYGSFSLLVRDINDTDKTPVVYERFDNLNTNPLSDNFIGKRIGDRSFAYDSTNGKWTETGQYDIQSSYVRVELSEELENGTLDQSLLPFGFRGLPIYRGINFLSGGIDAGYSLREINLTGAGDTSPSSILALGGTSSFPPAAIAEYNGLYDMINGGAVICSGSYLGTGSLIFPGLPLRQSSADGKLSKHTNAFFGLSTNQSPAVQIFDGTIQDLVRIKPTTTVSKDMILSPGFSLDNLVVTSTTGHTVSASYSGSEIGDYCGNILGSSGEINGTSPYRGRPGGARRSPGYSKTAMSGAYSVLNANYNRFTVPLYGGFNGFDIQEKNWFTNTRALLPTTGKATATNAPFYTLKKAIDSVTDVDQVNINMAAMPGITDPQVTDLLLSMAEDRKDTLSIIDLQGGYTASTENSDAFSDRKGSSTQTVSDLDSRNINNSYGAAYYPWVQIRDTAAGANLWVPPSTVALGVLASSAARAELWFAPAGFNRGGLNNTNAGLNVINIVEKLTSDQRDDLYDVGVNPIASFPSEGIVVFGQKTLQANKSALDRINVRRLMIYLRKQITIISNEVLFDPNTQITWNRFLNRVNPFLESIKNRFGLADYRVILDETTTTPDLIDRNVMYAKILLKPTRAIEFIALDFVITRSGVEF
jgi:hypothetical protein